MNIEITMHVKVDIEVDDNSTLFYGKIPDKWNEDDITDFKNEIAADFNMYNLGKLNIQDNTNYRVISFE